MSQKNHTVRKLLDIITQFVSTSRPARESSPEVYLDSHFEKDLGLDSLSKAELMARIERAWDIALGEQVLAVAQSPRDLLRAIAQADRRSKKISVQEVEMLAEPARDQVPVAADTLLSVLDWHLQAHADRPHIRLLDGEMAVEQMTYGMLYQGAQRVAEGLMALGLQPGQTVAIMLPTGSDYFYCFMGVLKAGGIPVPLYPPARPTQIEDHLRRHLDILNNAQVQVLITLAAAKAIGHWLKSQVPSLRKVVVSGAFSEIAASTMHPRSKATDIAFLQYTSGSTGTPKGVILTHANLRANIRTMAKTFDVDSSDTFVSWLPLYHDMGLIGAWLSSLYCAVPLVLMSPLTFLAQPSRWMWAIHKHRGTISAGPNFAYEYCLTKIPSDEIEGLDLSSWRLAVNGAEQVSPATLTRFQQRFGEYGFRPETMTPSYGLAETSVGLSFSPEHRPPKIDRIGRDRFMRTRRATPAEKKETDVLSFVSCGHPLEGHEIRIVDAAGREAAEREEGRLFFKGPSCTSGYFRNPAGSAALFDGDWLDSGDLAYVAEGEVYLTGRSKDIIIRAGRNIYPAELEEVVGRIKGVRKGCVAVFGSTDSVSGTEKLVVLAETRETDTDVRADLLRKVLSAITDILGAPPDDVVLAPPHRVLKTSSGKVRRTASRALYESGSIHKKPRAVWWQSVRLVWQGALPQLRRMRQTAAALLYAGYIYLLVAVLTPVTWTAVVATPGFSRSYAVMRRFDKWVFRLATIPLRVRGLENLASFDHCILVSNHCSYADGAILAAVLPVQFSFVAKRELTRYMVTRLFMQRLRTVFVERFDNRKGTADARRVIRSAREGQSFIFFPEGTFYRMPGLQAFRMGAFLTAVRAGVPVVPIAIRGSRSLLRGDTWFPRRGAVSVTVSAPIFPEGDQWEDAVKLRDKARGVILKYCGEPDLGS